MQLPSNIPQCRHTKLNGLRCGSPALHGKPLCHFHTQLGREHRPGRSNSSEGLAITLPLLEDANAIQLALMQIIQSVLADTISDKKAGLLLYALQTASNNLKHMNVEPQAELLQQHYPDAVAQMVKQAENLKDENSLARLLLTTLGIPFDGAHPATATASTTSDANPPASQNSPSSPSPIDDPISSILPNINASADLSLQALAPLGATACWLAVMYVLRYISTNGRIEARNRARADRRPLGEAHLKSPQSGRRIEGHVGR